MNRRTVLTGTGAALVAGNAFAAAPIGIGNPPKPLLPAHRDATLAALDKVMRSFRLLG